MSSLHDADFLSTLPSVLKNDAVLNAVAAAIAVELQLLLEDTEKAVIYTMIDELPEELLDIIAYDFKVDWYDDGYSISEKRATLQDSWNVHRKLGTKYAVEKALSAIYENTNVQEWFEYSGDPYHFKLRIPVDQTTLDLTKHETVLGLVDYYKNLRSVLDEVEYYGSSGAAIAYSTAAIVGIGTIVSMTAYNY